MAKPEQFWHLAKQSLNLTDMRVPLIASCTPCNAGWVYGPAQYNTTVESKAAYLRATKMESLKCVIEIFKVEIDSSSPGT